MLTEQDLPGWAQTAATLLLGAGAAKMMAVWLENRRLAKKEYRETLLERIRELEQVVASLQTRVGNMREEMGRLMEENRHLREHVERGEGHVHDDVPRRADGSTPS